MARSLQLWGLKHSGFRGYVIQQKKMHLFGAAQPETLVCPRQTLFMPVVLM